MDVLHMVRLYLVSDTYLSLGQLIPIGCQVKQNTGRSARQSDTTYEQNNEHNVWKKRSEIDNLYLRMLFYVFYNLTINYKIIIDYIINIKLAFPDDLTPLHKQRNTMSQAANRHRDIDSLMEPVSSIPDEIPST